MPNASATATFDLEAYRELLTDLGGRGYTVKGFHEAEQAEPHLVLRHDIDLSPTAALPMARLERELEAKATYFFLTRSALYNLQAPSCMSVLAELIELGHEIGLHFDASLYDEDGEALSHQAGRECDFLQSLTGRPVSMVSFHRPARNLLNAEAAIGGRRHTYEPYFFSEMGYCSDSRGGWYHGHPLDHGAVARKGALQLLTHPIWWVVPGAVPQEKMMNFHKGLCRDIDVEISRNIDFYEPYFKP